MSVPFIFGDIETTGLNAGENVTLEVALLAVNEDLEVVERLHVLIRPGSWSVLDDMDPFVWEMHTTNGLLSAVAREGVTRRDAAQQIADFFGRHGDRSTLFAGNSPHAVDVPFLRVLLQSIGGNNWPLSHRNLDMTAVQYGMTAAGLPFPNSAKAAHGTSHRAMDDAEGALNQLRVLRAVYAPIVDWLTAENARPLQTIEETIGDFRREVLV